MKADSTLALSTSSSDCRFVMPEAASTSHSGTNSGSSRDHVEAPGVPSGGALPIAHPSDYVWFCCRCGDGPNFYEGNSHCGCCNEARCSNCVIERA
ncbi:hypothetical protein EJ04DRAFT_516684 [Polyplosphaeria fusca]|uniref:Uncharacterized protein n=1 Tax=Polyplosphaeria fusca TaxID=682080 RepID=A0A9P4QP38_9PLEO|nr:hypothetical protein EJ04DRAFT_516684 [Polyplosphaeria fusca]